MSRPKISLTDAVTGKRVRVAAFRPGDALVPEPLPILGYVPHAEHGWTVYVNGTMPPAMRSAVEDGHTDQEVLLVAELPAGIREITLPDHRREFSLKQAA